MPTEPSNDAQDEEPDSKSKRKHFLLRVSPDLWEEVRAWASNDMRSVNAQIEYLLREAVKRRRAEQD